MPKNKRLPEVLLSKLHGKGTMSEILDIERAQLLKQSEQDMQRQLGATGTPDGGTPTSDVKSAASSVGEQPAGVVHGGARLDAEELVANSPAAVDKVSVEMVGSEGGSPSPFLGGGDVGSLGNPAEATPFVRVARTPVAGVEGLSPLSRVVGDDLSEFGMIFRHSVLSVSSPPHFSPEPCQGYYAQSVDPTLAFTAERNLLTSIRRLTLGWGTLSCQITLDLLSAACGIRNIKTLRKWLADLHQRKHIRYTPVHGDLRGSIVTLTPPEEVRAILERWWRDGVSSSAKMSSSFQIQGGRGA
jgi:hypothetical protein